MISTSVMLDTREVQAVIDQLPKSIFRAKRSAIATTTTWAKKKIQSNLVSRTGIDAKVFKQFRVKSRRFKESGKVWLGYNEIKAAYVGKLSQEPAGAWAGQYYFPGGFIATMKSGHTGIFKNKPGSRSIVEQVVNLNIGVEVAEQVAKQAEQELKRRFAEKLMQYDKNLK